MLSQHDLRWKPWLSECWWALCQDLVELGHLWCSLKRIPASIFTWMKEPLSWALHKNGTRSFFPVGQSSVNKNGSQGQLTYQLTCWCWSRIWYLKQSLYSEAVLLSPNTKPRKVWLFICSPSLISYVHCSLRNRCSWLGSFLCCLPLVALVEHSPWKCSYKCLLYMHASLDSCWQSRNPSPDSCATSAPSLYQLAQTHGKWYCALLWAMLQWPCVLVLAHVHTAVVPISLFLLFCLIHSFQLVAGLQVCHCSMNEPHWSCFHKSCGETLLCFSSFSLAAVRSLHKF